MLKKCLICDWLDEIIFGTFVLLFTPGPYFVAYEHIRGSVGTHYTVIPAAYQIMLGWRLGCFKLGRIYTNSDGLVGGMLGLCMRVVS